MMALVLTALFAASGAQPELFGFTPVDSITSPPDAQGEVAWSTADMIIGKGWRPTTYDAQVVEALFGPPRKLAPDVRGWAFAHVDAPEFGVLLSPIGQGMVAPFLWDWGSVVFAKSFEGHRLTSRSGSAWLNALADFQREVARTATE